MSDDLTAVFRVSATVMEPVKYSALREAVEITSKRFPYFNVSLGSGLFWHFLEFNDKLPRIQAEEDVPCTSFAVTRKDELLYRIIVKGRRISVEFIHILTDGGGALEYLKSLLYTYLTITGNSIDTPDNIILPETPLSDEEFEDGYNKFFRKLPPPTKMLKVWHLPYRLNKKPRLRVIQSEVYSNEILEKARSFKVSLTEYLISVYLISLQKIYLEEKKKRKQKHQILRIEVPLNLRRQFPSRTMRNFSLYVLPEIDMRLGTYTFEEIIRAVHHQLQMSSESKQIARFLSSNVSYEKLFVVRILPLFIKKMAITSIYRGFASRRWTGIVTNLGLINLPGNMQQLVDSLEIIPPPPNPNIKVSMGLVSFKDKLRICFCNISQSNELERLILKHLTDEGIRVRILNNP